MQYSRKDMDITKKSRIPLHGFMWSSMEIVSIKSRCEVEYAGMRDIRLQTLHIYVVSVSISIIGKTTV